MNVPEVIVGTRTLMIALTELGQLTLTGWQPNRWRL